MQAVACAATPDRFWRDADPRDPLRDLARGWTHAANVVVVAQHRHEPPGDLGEEVAAGRETRQGVLPLAEDAFATGRGAPGALSYGSEHARRSSEVIEDDAGLGESRGELGHVAELRRIDPGVEAQASSRSNPLQKFVSR